MPEFNLIDTPLKIGKEKIERIGSDCQKKSVKFVGFTLDDKLNWESHLNQLSSTISFNLYSINQAKHLLSSTALELTYNSLIKPHLEYGIILWGGAKNSSLMKIEKLQKKAIRCVAKAHYNSHTEPLMGKLSILNIADLHMLKIGEFVSKYLQKSLPPTVLSEFTPLLNERSMRLRNEKPNFKSLDLLPKALVPKLWNELPHEMRKIGCHKKFKRLFKKERFKKYTNFRCTKIRCYPCKK